MFHKTNFWRGLALVCALLLSVSVMAGIILEDYRTSVDAFVGTRSQEMVTEESEDGEDAWNFQSEFQTAQEAYEGLRDIAIRESRETVALLKNENSAFRSHRMRKSPCSGSEAMRRYTATAAAA